MSSNKKCFWLKLKNDFFDQKEIKTLRRLAGACAKIRRPVLGRS